MIIEIHEARIRMERIDNGTPISPDLVYTASDSPALYTQRLKVNRQYIFHPEFKMVLKNTGGKVIPWYTDWLGINELNTPNQTFEFENLVGITQNVTLPQWDYQYPTNPIGVDWEVSPAPSGVLISSGTAQIPEPHLTCSSMPNGDDRSIVTVTLSFAMMKIVNGQLQEVPGNLNDRLRVLINFKTPD